MSTIDLSSDFDWFAQDSDGALALFATAGAGFVPSSVVEYHVMHETVAGGIEYPHWGSEAIWQDVAALGLYAYDWDGETSAYRCAAQPTGTFDPALEAMIRRISELPRLAGAFAASAHVASVSAFAAAERA